jgi:hypothetical protein
VGLGWRRTGLHELTGGCGWFCFFCLFFFSFSREECFASQKSISPLIYSQGMAKSQNKI